eukprot:1729853-Alexandrium_andersonii.AAC.1
MGHEEKNSDFSPRLAVKVLKLGRGPKKPGGEPPDFFCPDIPWQPRTPRPPQDPIAQVPVKDDAPDRVPGEPAKYMAH